jgi:hypothetical protein
MKLISKMPSGVKCVVLSLSGYQEALREQKHKDEKINLIEKQLEA